MMTKLIPISLAVTLGVVTQSAPVAAQFSSLMQPVLGSASSFSRTTTSITSRSSGDGQAEVVVTIDDPVLGPVVHTNQPTPTPTPTPTPSPTASPSLSQIMGTSFSGQMHTSFFRPTPTPTPTPTPKTTTVVETTTRNSSTSTETRTTTTTRVESSTQTTTNSPLTIDITRSRPIMIINPTPSPMSRMFGWML